MELIIAILMSLGVFTTPVEGFTTAGHGNEITNTEERNADAPVRREIVVPDPNEF